MKTFWTIIKNSIRLHKYLLLVGFISLLIYGGFIQFTLLRKYNDPGNALQFSSFLIQSGMLLFILLGFRLASKELTETFYQIGKNEVKKLHLFNLTFLILLAILFVSLFIVATNIHYYLLVSSNSFSVESSLFLLHYWFIPFVTCGFIGYLLGLHYSNKLVYIAVFGIWIILSPTNLYFLWNLLANTELAEGVTWLRNLNLGVSRINDYYNPLFGFEFDWYKRLGLLTTILALVILSITYHKKTLKNVFLSLLLVTIVTYSLIPYNYSKHQLENVSDSLEEYNFYSQPAKIPPNEFFDYNIETVDLKIRNKKSFNVTAQIKFSNITNSKIAFTLYRGYRISHIALKNGTTIKFQQNGDFTIVELPDRVENTKLIIEYNGEGSFRNPSTQEALYLPDNFAWIPTNQRTHTHFLFNQEVMTASLNDLPLIKYTLTIQGNQRPYYTNLTSIDEDRYEGKAKGITIVGGDLTKIVNNGQEIIYPISWFPYEEELKSYVTEYTKKLKKYNDILDVNNKLPNKVFLLPIMNPFISGFSPNSEGDQSVILLQIIPSEFERINEIKDIVPFQIDNAFSSFNITNEKQKVDWLIFNSFIGFQISNKTDNTESIFLSSLYSIEVLLTKEEQVILQQLLDQKGKFTDYFFIKWRKILMDENANTWKHLNKLIIDNNLKGES